MWASLPAERKVLRPLTTQALWYVSMCLKFGSR
jgi:hypothetical protein